VIPKAQKDSMKSYSVSIVECKE